MRTLTKLSLLSLLVLSAACSGGGYDDGAEASDDDLTSASARARKLTFTGYVYVDEDASDSEIVAQVRKQTQTAFGALRTAEVGVASRELKDVDPSTFTKTKVTVASPSSSATRTMQKVSYVYKDSAVVPVAMATRTALSTAVMSPSYASQNARILKECTAGDDEAVEFENSIWYVFDPSVSGCHTAIATEQKTIDADTAKIPAGDVSESEVARLYLPITVRLASAKTYAGTTYPEYDKLWSGGVKSNRLVISYVNGLIDDKSYPHMSQDSAWGEWIDQLREAMKDRAFTFASIDNGADLSNYTVAGKNVKLPNGFMDIVNGNVPAGVSESALLAAASDKVTYHWLHFETKVSVKIGSAQPKTVTVELMTYFGSTGDATPHKYAVKNSDVFVYNGHSYIGYGPLDPSNFSASDFPSSYQMLFIDGCVSYNYYNHGYYDLKAGGTKNLDMIVNGMEAPSWHSGYALGRFTHELIDGSQSSYLNLLKAAVDTDEVGGSLRVVDGEVDNVYKPSKTPITVK